VNAKRVVVALAAGVFLAGGAPLAGQRGDVLVDITSGPVGRLQRSGDEGPVVQMFESSNLDRFLHKAQDFMRREDFTGAIQVLQDVLEGRTLHDPTATDPGIAEPQPAKPADPKKQPAAPRQETERWRELIDDGNPSHSVFSSDQRLYRPVRRLCHELLAAMPEAGQALYREKFEVQAERELAEALARRDRAALAQVSNRWFVTLAAGKALRAAGDLLLDEGRGRGALQTYRVLLELYPEALRKRIPGAEDTTLLLRIALAHRVLGDWRLCRSALATLREKHPLSSVRIQGELVPVADLEQHELFAGAGEAAPVIAPSRDRVALRPGSTLVPLWEHRFATPSPYSIARGRSGQEELVVVREGGQRVVALPGELSPGTSLQWDGDRVAFFDHYRLRIAAADSGLHLLESNGPDQAPVPAQGRARSRVPVYDLPTLRYVPDGGRCYALIGPRDKKLLAELRPVLENELVAYDRQTLEQLWTTSDWNGRDGRSRLTFLAAPAVHSDLLVLPMLDRGAYGVAAVDARTGELRWRTPVHAGGTVLARAPTVPLQVQGGIAYLQSNAGVIAALDVNSGDLLWARRYERLHPYRSQQSMGPRGGPGNAFAGTVLREESTLAGFAQSDLIAIDGRLILAPTDGRVLLCLDGATGDVLWLASKPTGARLQHVVGCNSRHLFVAGATLLCIDHRTGIRLWEVEMPSAAWNGRGLVTEEMVVMPSERAVLVLALEGPRRFERVALPAFHVGDAPLAGPCNLVAQGPYVAACYQGGIEMYADLRTLQELAQATSDPERRVDLLVRIGDLTGALDLLEQQMQSAELAAERRDRLARRFVTLAREVALAMAQHGEPQQGLAVLERVRPHVETHDSRGQWHLARIEVLRTANDDAGETAEQVHLQHWIERRR
jgi:outer membrane protein assembly factor BamB